MKTLESLGFIKDIPPDFCPNLERMEFTNGKRRIVFWKDNEVSIFANDGQTYTPFSYDEMQACIGMMNRKGWR